MSTTSPAVDLVESFYTAYNNGQLAECEAIVDQLREQAKANPGLAAWAYLLQGILVNEREHDWAQGERLFRQALASAGDQDLLLRARAGIALGVTDSYLGRWADAIQAYELSLDALAHLNLPIDTASALKQIGIAGYNGYMQGEFDESVLAPAARRCQEALAVLAAADQTSEVERIVAATLNTLGSLFTVQSRWDEAIDAYRRHLATCQALDNRCCMGISHANLGAVYHQLGPAYRREALEELNEALDIFGTCDGRYTRAIVEVLGHLALLQQEAGDFDQALRTYEQALAQIEALRAGITSEAGRAGYFATVAGTFAFAVFACVDSGRFAEAFDLVERARSRAFLDLLAGGLAELKRQVQAETSTLAQVQDVLPPDVLLLEYFSSGVVEAKDRRASTLPAERHRFPPARVLLFAVTRGEIQVFDAGLSPNNLLPQRLQAATERHFLQPEIRRTLYDRLIRPVAHLLAGKRRVYLVPHGPLHYVPFHALLAPDGETLLRPDGPELVYGPSASVLFRQSAPKSPRPETAEGISNSCLALGYNGDGMHRLRFAEDETRSVAALLGGEALAGPASKRQALFRQGADARYLHISCHGEFDPEEPLESRLYLSANETLTAHEVLEGLRLNCNLVTLSACESGLSRVRRGDELMGLVRAFMVAGAPAVIATLWRVDERSTRILMERFYREIAAGAGFAHALCEAQLFLRSLSQSEVASLLAGDAPAPGTGEAGADRPFADPFYWAPFILIGAG